MTLEEICLHLTLEENEPSETSKGDGA